MFIWSAPSFVLNTMEMSLPWLEEGSPTLTVLLIAAVALFVSISFVVALAMKCSLSWSGAGSHGLMRCSLIVFLCTIASMLANVGLVMSGVTNPLVCLLASVGAWVVVVQLMTGCGIGSSLVAYLLNGILSGLGVATVAVATVVATISFIPAEDKQRLAEGMTKLQETQFSDSLLESIQPVTLSDANDWKGLESPLSSSESASPFQSAAPQPSSFSLPPRQPSSKLGTPALPKGVQSNPFVQ